jgi:hypothetical protein
MVDCEPDLARTGGKPVSSENGHRTFLWLVGSGKPSFMDCRIAQSGSQLNWVFGWERSCRKIRGHQYNEPRFSSKFPTGIWRESPGVTDIRYPRFAPFNTGFG